jgi:hypothetical protein
MPLVRIASDLVRAGAENTLDYLLLIAYCELHDCVRDDCGCEITQFIDECYRDWEASRDTDREWYYPIVRVIE